MKKHIRNSSDILSIYPWPQSWQWVMTRTLTRPPNPVFSFKTCCVCSLGQFVRVWSLNNHKDGWHYGHEGTPAVEETSRQDIRIQPGLQRQLLLGIITIQNIIFNDTLSADAWLCQNKKPTGNIFHKAGGKNPLAWRCRACHEESRSKVLQVICHILKLKIWF